MANLQGWFGELRRRNVVRAALVYVAAVWALAQGIAQLSPAFGLPDWLTRWFVIACTIGLPFWLAFAWYYEFTPQGIRREAEVAIDESAGRSRRRRVDYWIIAIMSVAIVLLVTNQFVLRRDATGSAEAADARAIAEALARAPDKSVAVLPFANQSGDPKQDYFSDGLSEELIADLTRIAGLRVIGKSSSFRFRNSKDGPAVIAARLGVAHLIEGSVRQSGNRFRIVVGMVRAADGSSVWSQSYDRELADVFAVQSEIAGAVASALKVKMLGNPVDASDRPPSGNVQAYEAFLLGRFHQLRFTEPELRKAIGYFGQATELDPSYAAAWAGLAFANVNLGNQLPRAGREQAWAAARKALARARALNPELPTVLRARVYVMSAVDFDFAGALAETRRLLALTPNDPPSLEMMGGQLMNAGQLKDALAMYDKALALDPLSSLAYANTARILTALGRFDEAERAVRKRWELNPAGRGLEGELAMLQMLRGDPGPALRFAEQTEDRDQRLWWEAMAWHAQGDAARSDAALREYIERKNGDEYAYSIAAIHAWRHRPNEMFGGWTAHGKTANRPRPTFCSTFSCCPTGTTCVSPRIAARSACRFPANRSPASRVRADPDPGRTLEQGRRFQHTVTASA